LAHSREEDFVSDKLEPPRQQCYLDFIMKRSVNKKLTSVAVGQDLVKKARKTLKSSSDSEAVTQALLETLANREIQATLKRLIRKGRGRFVDVYS